MRNLEDRPSRRSSAWLSPGQASRTSSAPSCSTDITGQAFPRDTRKHVYIDGGIETVIGLGLTTRKTRPLAIIGLIGYGAYLAGNVVRNR